MDPDRLAFSLTQLADAAHAPRPLSACGRGHLVVAGNTHWQAEAFTDGLKKITCVLVADCDE